MDKETREQLIDECIEALQQTSKVLNQNIRQIQDAYSREAHTQDKANAYGILHLLCRWCGDPFSVVQYADAVLF